MRKQFLPTLLLVVVAAAAPARELRPDASYFAQFQADRAPKVTRRLLRAGDRLAICGDSITEQKMYSRIIEDYLTVAVPELDVTVRQFGWSGETAPGFRARLTNDVLRFQPTLVTTCYGMNDHGYKPYEFEVGARYRSNSLALVKAFKAHGARVIQGSPGCVGPKLPWGFVKGTSVEKNQSLCTLRNLGIGIARSEKVAFADIFWPMLQAEYEGRQKLGETYLIAGGDGVHPGWAGHLVMAYAFLRAMGLDGEIGTFIVDLKVNKATVSKGHELVSCADGLVTVRSSRYPFCACLAPEAKASLPGENYPVCGQTNELTSSDSLRSALALIPFNQELNRLTLIVKRPHAGSYRVTWGSETKSFAGAHLKRGVNLAEAFPSNPFSDAFARVDAAVLAKQNFETVQIKQKFHGDDGRRDMEGTVAQTEAERALLAAAIRAAVVPVTHTIRIQAE